MKKYEKIGEEKAGQTNSKSFQPFNIIPGAFTNKPLKIPYFSNTITHTYITYFVKITLSNYEITRCLLKLRSILTSKYLSEHRLAFSCTRSCMCCSARKHHTSASHLL